jgi:hypothetical protein
MMLVIGIEYIKGYVATITPVYINYPLVRFWIVVETHGYQ